MFPLLDYPTLRLFLDGMLLMMILYALFSYGVHQQPLYLYYMLYMGSMLIYLHIRSADVHQPATMKPFSGWHTSVESITFLFYIQFATTLMQIRQNDAWSYQTLQRMTWVLGVSGLVGLGLFFTNVSSDVVRWLHVASRLYLVVCTVLILPRLAKIKHPVLPYFVAGTALFILFSTITLLSAIKPTIFGSSAQHAFANPLVYMQIGVVLEVLCYTMGISVQNRQTEQEKISSQAQLIEQLQENERKQVKLYGLRDEIARDLHDEIGSQLSTIGILSHTTARYVTDERAHQRLATIEQTARQVMDSLREIVWSLNSSSDTLQHVGLRIGETAHTLFCDGTVRLHADLAETNQPLGLTEKQRRELHLIAKECLTNSFRHAYAQNIWLILRAEPNMLILTIRDDGIGFKPELDATGLGLRNMRQRARALGATLTIFAEPGAGTSIRIDCPVAATPDQPTQSPTPAETMLVSA